MHKRKISWDKEAVTYLSKAIHYIRQDSPKNADKVKKEILKKISKLSQRPEIHNSDKYKSDNTGNYRAFELHRFRISYLVKEDEIIIARIRHTSQEPQQY
ncbi:MAG TPA: type II toxin-antitoxin system RelE/ParE family toxin [Puia sp.]|nr:type II toxin-antitoxin system RelE/ParE family toxin [Puia sp.]